MRRQVRWPPHRRTGSRRAPVESDDLAPGPTATCVKHCPRSPALSSALARLPRPPANGRATDCYLWKMQAHLLSRELVTTLSEPEEAVRLLGKQLAAELGGPGWMHSLARMAGPASGGRRNVAATCRPPHSTQNKGRSRLGAERPRWHQLRPRHFRHIPFGQLSGPIEGHQVREAPRAARGLGIVQIDLRELVPGEGAGSGPGRPTDVSRGELRRRESPLIRMDVTAGLGEENRDVATAGSRAKATSGSPADSLERIGDTHRDVAANKWSPQQVAIGTQRPSLWSLLARPNKANAPCWLAGWLGRNKWPARASKTIRETWPRQRATRPDFDHSIWTPFDGLRSDSKATRSSKLKMAADACPAQIKPLCSANSHLWPRPASRA